MNRKLSDQIREERIKASRRTGNLLREARATSRNFNRRDHLNIPKKTVKTILQEKKMNLKEWLEYSGFTIGGLQLARGRIYEENGYKTSPLIARIDRTISELLRLRRQLSTLPNYLQS